MNVLRVLIENRLREFGRIAPNQIYKRLNLEHKDDFDTINLVDNLDNIEKKYDAKILGMNTFTDVQYGELSDYFKKSLSPYANKTDLDWDKTLIDVMAILYLRSKLQFVPEGQMQGFNFSF